MTTTSDRPSNNELDRDTNLPRTMSLGSVLNEIRLTPGELSRFLRDLASPYLGSAHHEMGLALRDHADLVSDPRTYGYTPPQQPASAGPREYSPPTPESVQYSESFKKPDEGERISRKQLFNRPAEVPTPTPAGQPVSQQVPPYTSPTATDKPQSQTDDFEAEARRRGWAPPTETPRTYTPPSGPDVDPKYRAPYTSSGASEQTPPQPLPPQGSETAP